MRSGVWTDSTVHSGVWTDNTVHSGVWTDSTVHSGMWTDSTVHSGVWTDSTWWCVAVPTAAHCMVPMHSTCFKPILMTCCAYSCTQYSLHTQYMLLTNADDLLCLQLHTIQFAHTVHGSKQCWWLAVPTAAHSNLQLSHTFKVFPRSTLVQSSCLDSKLL